MNLRKLFAVSVFVSLGVAVLVWWAWSWWALLSSDFSSDPGIPGFVASLLAAFVWGVREVNALQAGKHAEPLDTLVRWAREPWRAEDDSKPRTF